MLKAKGLEYEANGTGEAVLLIHGALVADAFVPLMREPALADRYRLIRYRRRGHGGSDPVSGVCSLAQQAQDAAALMTALGVERTHVVGHSGGGAIAVQLAIDAPDLVHTLVVLEPAIMAPDVIASFVEGAAPVREAYRSGDVAKALDLWMSAVSAADWRSVVANTAPGAAELAAKDAPTFFELELPTLSEWVFDRDQTRRLTQPILYVLGGESGPLFEAGRQHFRSLMPHTEEVVVPGVNHLMQVRDPKLVAAPIVEFLSRHPVSGNFDAGV
jgi:pimeloyl-ACP methyl ester carboxylesterase